MTELIVPHIATCDILGIEHFALSARLVKMKLKTGQTLQLPRKLFSDNTDPFAMYRTFTNNQSLIKVK